MKNRRTPDPRSTLLSLEQLEQRTLLSVSGALWEISGTPQNDSFEVMSSRPGFIEVTRNGTSLGEQSRSELKAVRISAGDGDDTINIEGDLGVRIIVIGQDGNDYIHGSSSREVLRGGSGNDTIIGGGRSDVLFGGPGDDEINGNRGPDRIFGGTGSDGIAGGPHDDWVVASGGQDTVWGNEGNDTIRGGQDDDWLYGGLGRDIVRGGGGNDYLASHGESETADDTKRDFLHGGGGNNLLITSEPHDILRSGQAQFEASNVDTSQLEEFIRDIAIDAWSHLFGQVGTPSVYGIPLLPGLDIDTTALREDGTDTNVQEQGVDEGDIVESDGVHLYILSDDQLTIVSTGELAIRSRTTLDGPAIAQFLNGDRLTVITHTPTWYFEPLIDAGPSDDVARLSLPAFEATPPVTTITVFDVTDPDQPTIVEQNKIDGSYVDSRAVQDYVYVIVQNSFWDLPRPLLVCQGNDVCTYETSEEYVTRMDESGWSSLLPSFDSTDANGETVRTGSLLSDNDTIRSPEFDDRNMTTVVSFDVMDDVAGLTDSASVFDSYSSTIYASLDSIYIVSEEWVSQRAVSLVSQLDFDSGQLDVAATGKVPGRIHDQFSLDEHDGNLRMAVTSGLWQQESNDLYVLEQQGDSLTIIGSLTGIAPGERIFSARFLEDVAFMVTFERVDPLFSVDLSNPSKPELKGELIMPGFSSYLHPIQGGEFLIGVGRDADLSGRIRGMQISLFDVRDLEQPILMDKITINPDGWIWSEAEWDHHAITFDSRTATLSLPLSQSGHDETGTYFFNHALMLINVDVLNGLNLVGEVGHETQVRRSLWIEDLIYSISRDQVKAISIAEGEPTVKDEITYSPSH